MAKYGISTEGVSALKQLAQDITTLSNDIENNGRSLKTKINSLGEGLGIYEEYILELVECVNSSQEKGRESIELLGTKVNLLADEVEALVNAGLA